MSTVERTLNDYESMLATSTCNVGVQCTIVLPSLVSSTSTMDILEHKIHQAWYSTVEQRGMLQIRLELTGEMGMLGPRYKTVSIPKHDNYPPRVHISFVKQEDEFVPNENDNNKNLLVTLQRQGTTELEIDKSAYVFSAIIDARRRRTGDNHGNDSNNTVQAGFFLTLCHAVSDGPGSLYVLNDFLKNLETEYNSDNSSNHEPSKSPIIKYDSLIDLQAKLLSDSYGTDLESRTDCYTSLQDFQSALTNNSGNTTDDANTFVHNILPPESMQQLPTDDDTTTALSATPTSNSSEIRALSFTLSKDLTASLRKKCRDYGGTIQGAISVACLLTRIKLLNKETTPLPLLCALQIPVNTRSAASNNTISLKECLCGSAGIWHTLAIEPASHISDLIGQASKSVQEAIENKQHLEWLRRLFNDPATLPPYSLMVSSIGIAPIQEEYGPNIQILEGAFFGGALVRPIQSGSSPPQATMVHVTTFCDKLEFTLSYTYPGVSNGFASKTLSCVETFLVNIAEGQMENTMASSFLLQP